jgi:DeoR family suf operon transcriptional repressor
MAQVGDRQDTRDQIIRVLKTKGRATVLGLADQVNVSAVTIRHHLSGLQADGLVDATLERGSVGRPRHVYHLTDAGEELFPSQYLSLSKRLLDRINSSLSPNLVSRLFEDMARQIVNEHAHQLRQKSWAERMDILTDILEAEGFMVTWEDRDGEYRVIEHNCPYRNLAHDFPAVCQLDKTLIAAVLEAPAEKIRCQVEGADDCAFRVRITNTATGATNEPRRDTTRHQEQPQA